jgi:hypothetical protein
LDHVVLRALASGEMRDEVDGLAKELRSGAYERPFGDLLKGLERVDEKPPWMQVGIRSANILRRARMHTWDDLAQVTPYQLWNEPNLGSTSFAEIVRVLVSAWARCQIDGPSSGPEPGTTVDVEPNDGELASSESPDWGDLFVDVEDVLHAMWTELGARTVLEGLQRWPPRDVSDEVIGAFERLRDLDIASVLGLRSANEQAWRELLNFEFRDRLILSERVFADGTPATLAVLGGRLGVTRERVRQLERKVREQVEKRITHAPGTFGIAHLASRVRREIGPVANVQAAREIIAHAVAETSASDEAELALRRRMLESLAGPYEIDRDLFLTPAAKALINRFRVEIGDLAPGELVGLATVTAMLEGLGGSNELRGELLSRLGLHEIGDVCVPWRRSLNDKAVAVLAAIGRPLAMFEIHELVGLDANPRSFANVVQAEFRIMRRGKDRYGLRSWGGEEYTGILEELEQAVERAGGRVSLEDLIATFVEEFGVASQSVRAYAADRRFVRHDDGTIALRGADDPDVSYRTQPIDLTPGAYRIDGTWHVRFDADFDLLRGSGRPLRRGVAVAVGLEPDLTMGLTYGDETVTFSWSGSQPTVGSLRRVAHAHGCSEGDLLFLPLEGPEQRDSRIVRASDLTNSSGLRRLALEMGLTGEIDEDDIDIATAAVGLPVGADMADLADRLHDRGEEGLVALLPERWR